MSVETFRGDITDVSAEIKSLVRVLPICPADHLVQSQSSSSPSFLRIPIHKATKASFICRLCAAIPAFCGTIINFGAVNLNGRTNNASI